MVALSGRACAWDRLSRRCRLGNWLLVALARLEAGRKPRPARPETAFRPLLPVRALEFGLARAGRTTEDDAGATEQKTYRHQRQGSDQESALAHGYFSSAARAFS